MGKDKDTKWNGTKLFSERFSYKKREANQIASRFFYIFAIKLPAHL